MAKINAKKPLLTALFCLLLLALLTLPGLATPGPISTPVTPWPENYVPGQLLVGMAAPVSPVSASLFPGLDILSLQDITDVSSFLPPGASGTYSGRQILLLELDTDAEADMRAAVVILEGYSSVAYAEPNFTGSACALPDTPDLENLWGMERIGAELAWEISTGSSGVLVGVLDSGIDYNHTGLGDNVDETLGYNFLQNNPYWWYDTSDPLDDFGHGTHAAGIIGAAGGNEEGVVGLNWDVTLVPLKIWDGGGYGSGAEFVAALAYAECLEIPVLSISGGWAGVGGFAAMRDAVEAYSGLIVAAAGNERNDNDVAEYAYYPAAFGYENIISVAASNQEDALTEFSGYGVNSIDLAAPGSDILSTVDYWLWDIELGWYTEYGYESFSGTSAAVPHVAGTAALLKAAEPGLSAAGMKAAILENVDTCQGLTGLVSSGGRLNAYAALSSLGQTAAQVPATIVFSQSGYAAAIPGANSLIVVAAAQVLDQNGAVMSGCYPDYSLQSEYSGVSVNGSGKVSVNFIAAAGTAYIVASYGPLAPVSVPLALSDEETVPYTLYLDSEYGYTIDAYDGIDQPVTVGAYAMDSLGAVVTEPELASIEYTADSGVSNTSGIFSKEELEISPGEETNVTVTATFSGGIVLEEVALVVAPFILPRR